MKTTTATLKGSKKKNYTKYLILQKGTKRFQVFLRMQTVTILRKTKCSEGLQI